MKNLQAMATALFNGEFICLIAQSIGMLAYPEPTVPPLYLSADVADSDLGAALRLALAGSRLVGPEDFQEIWSSGVIEKLEIDRENFIKEKYGYKNKSSIYRSANTCTISVIDDEIKVQPTHQKALDEYVVKKDVGPFPLYVSKAANNAELGAALRDGFKLCTSAIKQKI